VTLVPYQVPAQTMIALCGASVTLTGTIGFQAALAGLCSVVSEPYYSTENHYIQVRRFDEIESIPEKMRAFSAPKNMDARRRDLLKKLTGGSVPGDYFTFRKFDQENVSHREAIAPLIQTLNTHLPQFALKG
ncbi:MAG: hypothetical protein K8F25_18710, partial [Fimbriimonadaceae bacterium]|nr:hypothetical protein [Alphaproteobacteria bacterium]